MIGVGFRSKVDRTKINVLAKYADNELDTAVAMAQSLIRHNKGEMLVFLSPNGSGKVRILKRVKKTWRGKIIVR